jgi:hypothetical protein
VRNKHSWLLGPFVTCKENEVCEYCILGPIHNTLISLYLTNVPISLSVTIHLVGKACEGQTLLVIGPFCNLQRK